MPGTIAIGCNIIDTLIARLSTAGELLTDPTGDPAGRDHQLARLRTAFPFVSRAPDWLSFLHTYGGLTYVRGRFSSGFFGLSYSASLHILDGEGEPVDNG